MTYLEKRNAYEHNAMVRTLRWANDVSFLRDYFETYLLLWRLVTCKDVDDAIEAFQACYEFHDHTDFEKVESAEKRFLKYMENVDISYVSDEIIKILDADVIQTIPLRLYLLRNCKSYENKFEL